MNTNIAETANRLADLMEKGLNTQGVSENHEWFLWVGDDQIVKACALGMALIGAEGSAIKALSDWVTACESVIIYHTEYAAEVLGIDEAVTKRISADHERNLTTTKQIIECLRNNPEVYFY